LSLDYPRRLDAALRGVVRDVLAEVAREGLPGESHFYLTFRTDDPEVSVSPALRDRYPDEMTVVLQHQFWNLDVDEGGFSVTLRFGGSEERIGVPWRALTVFADPAEEFGLRLDGVDEKSEPRGDSAAVEPGEAADVVHLDDFRRERS
jgi:hypothetical protein